MSFISMPSGSPSPALPSLYEIEPAAAPPRRHLFQTALYRNRWLIIGLVAAFGLAAASANWWMHPYYQASSTLVVDHPNLHDAELTPQEYPPPVDYDREMQTELMILASRAVAMPVIRQLDLQQRDDAIRAALAHSKPGLSAAARDEIAYQVFAGKLKATPNKISSTVTVSYGADNPQLAAEVVNATTAEFLQRTLQVRETTGQDDSHWMRQQLAHAQQQLASDDDAVARFQQAHAYIPLAGAGGAESALLRQLDAANTAYSAAEAARIADQAAAQSYSGNVVAALPADLRNPAIDSATANVSADQQQLSTLEATYKPDFPVVVEARQQLQQAQRQLAGLRAQVTAGMQQRLASSQQREQQLKGLVDNLNREAAAASGLEMQFGVLQSRATAQRNLVETLREKLAEVELEATLPPVNIRVLDRAEAPLGPLYPRQGLDLGLGLGLGLLVGLGVALGREHWGETLTGVEAVTRGLGPALAPLGMIADQKKALAPTQALLPAANGVVEVSSDYAKIAANLVARCGAPPRAILVTSPNPGEGKTTTICQLGLALAAGGWRTLLVDADGEHPSCHRFFGLPSSSGLGAAQAGRKVTPISVAAHLDLVPYEENAPQPLQARAMAGLLEQWREHYDYILLDSPSGNSSGEAVLLSSLVEGVMVVLRWGRTRMAEAQQLCEELARARAPLVGTLFNRADPAAPSCRTYRPAKA